MSKIIKIYGEAEEQTVEQLKNCLDIEEGSLGVLCADNHLGYSQPIGGVVAYREYISPSGVGYDIGCGNKAVLTDLTIEDIDSDIPSIMDEISERISFGMGRKNNEPIDHPVLDEIKEANYSWQRTHYSLAAKQLGTVGAGNHYVDLFVDEQNRVWIGVHFGSRGFGHKTATHFVEIAGGKDGMMVPPAVLNINTDAGQAYIEAMELAGKYAYAGRDVVCDKVLEILGAKEIDSVHNHHNYAWKENHFDHDWWVIRKGATPAFPGQLGFVGSSMGEESVILEGTDDAEIGLFSTIHGAGRAMSRTEAKGKTKRRKKWECNNRDCDYFHTDRNQFDCPDHPEAKPLKRFYEEIKSKGKVDWELTKQTMKDMKIELRGGAADEAPLAYKRLNEVLDAHDDTIKIRHRLMPIGVVMAGPDIKDPFRD